MSKTRNLKNWMTTSVLLLVMVESNFAGQIIYVDTDAPGSNNGLSWLNAYSYLQVALDAASSSDIIRVAEGTYKPHEGIVNMPENERELTFQLKNGVTVEGGYAGYGEPEANARNVELYETILSGDLDGNDGEAADTEDLLVDPNRAENSYHVVSGSGISVTACLDGLTITGGNANGPWPDSYGGGMRNDQGELVISNCKFSSNSANSKGGGIYNTAYGDPNVTNCVFSMNAAPNGGAIYSQDGDPVISNCVFSGNSAEVNGGALYNTPSSDPTVSNCVFNMNSTGDNGGAMYCQGGDPVVSNCKFSGNSAGDNGGGMSLGNNNPTITYCSFIDNSAYNGGGIYNHENYPTLANCTFIVNSAGNAGGGIYNDHSGGGALLDNCTFISNSGGDAGGGIRNGNNTVLKSCILWGNTVPCITNYGGSFATVSYSDIQGGYPGTDNIDTDPLFIDLNGPDDILGTADDNLHLSGHSPCINAGDPSGDYTGQVDLDNQPRVTYGRVDMGTDEVFPIAGDFEPDEDVDFVDFAIFAKNWLVGVQ